MKALLSTLIQQNQDLSTSQAHHTRQHQGTGSSVLLSQQSIHLHHTYKSHSLSTESLHLWSNYYVTVLRGKLSTEKEQRVKNEPYNRNLEDMKIKQARMITVMEQSKPLESNISFLSTSVIGSQEQLLLHLDCLMWINLVYKLGILN